ncbi:MAG: hypothetical protein M0T74_15840 [Desulfitobacterium hafniense]|nr:hypothetical protein [Desulfitobacterium hafniense]
MQAELPYRRSDVRSLTVIVTRFEELLEHNFMKLLEQRPEKLPKDFGLHKGTALSEQETKLREKYAAETGWKQDVSNWPLRQEPIWPGTSWSEVI